MNDDDLDFEDIDYFAQGAGTEQVYAESYKDTQRVAPLEEFGIEEGKNIRDERERAELAIITTIRSPAYEQYITDKMDTTSIIKFLQTIPRLEYYNTGALILAAIFQSEYNMKPETVNAFKLPQDISKFNFLRYVRFINNLKQSK